MDTRVPSIKHITIFLKKTLNKIAILLFVGCNISYASTQNKSVISQESFVNTESKQETTGKSNGEITKNSKSIQQKPFEYLENIQLNKDITCGYNKNTARLINKPLSDLSANHPLHVNEGPGVDDVLVMEFKINQHADNNWLLVFSYGPSNDPSFLIYDSKTHKHIRSFGGTDIYIPGNNTLYIAGRENNYYYQKRKYIFKQNLFQEVKQPFYHVGLKSKTLKPIRLYADKKLTSQVAYLPADYDIEVILAAHEKTEDNHSLYLIKTTFGLIGWVKLKTRYYGDPETEVEGLLFKGD